MRLFAISVALVAFVGGSAQAQYRQPAAPSYPTYGTGSNSESHGVGGYVKPSTGGYVQPHQQTNPNTNRNDNYGTPGNYNPYTGKTR